MRLSKVLVVMMLVFVLLGLSGCDRDVEVSQTTEVEVTDAVETTEEVVAPLVVQPDIAKNILGNERNLRANRTIIIGPASIKEVEVTDDLQMSIDILRKGYEDLDSIAEDYPELLATKVEEDYGQVYYTFSDQLKLFTYGDDLMMLEMQFTQMSLNDVKVIPELNLIHTADLIVLTDALGGIVHAYQSDFRYEKVYYGDFLGDGALELAFVLNDEMDTHYFSIVDGVPQPILIDTLYHEIDAKTSAVLDDRSFEVTSALGTYNSLLPDKLFLNLKDSHLNEAPFYKSISSVIDKETMKAIMTCRWMWTNGLQGDIVLAEVSYAFEGDDTERVIERAVDMRYGDQTLVNRAFDDSEVVIKKDGKVLIDTAGPMEEQVRYFEPVSPFVKPEATDDLEAKLHDFERLGLRLEFTYFSDMLTYYTLTLSHEEYTLGDGFRVGMSKDEVIAQLGVPDLVNSRTLFVDTTWSYYVKDASGERLLNFYYGFKKVIFTFDGDMVREIRVEIFASPT